jgi:putative membrane protein
MTMRLVSKITLTLTGILVLAGWAPLPALAVQTGTVSQDTTQSQGSQGTPQGESTPSTTPSQDTPSTAPSQDTPSTAPSQDTPSTAPSQDTPSTTPSQSTQSTTQSEGSQGTTQGEGTQGTMQADQANQPRGAMNGPERKFVMEAAQGSMAEVELGRLATERAASDEVKQFGQRMVDDHSKASTELMDLAMNMKFAPPKELSPEMAKMKAQLSQLSGADFDREYMRMMVEDHEMDVKKFEKQATKGNAGSVKDFAAKTLPTLQEHLKMAKDINKRAKRGVSATSQTQSGQTTPTP